MRSSILICMTGLFFASVTLAAFTIADRGRYKSFHFTCDEDRIYTFDSPLFGTATSLEIYLGGWVEQGSVTVRGFPQRTPPEDNGYEFQLIADEALRDIARAYVGDWYGGPIELTPSDDAECYMKLVYKIR